jgi:aryl-alcohol dehydrogenase-like predicted oxidoreductase
LPRWGSPDDISEAVFNAYFDAGGNFIDTADVYSSGRREELVGEFIAKTECGTNLRTGFDTPLSKKLLLNAYWH